MSKNILVTGGAGYIGSHCVMRLAEAGFAPITLDNLTTGHKAAVLDGELIIGDLGDREALDRIFTTHAIDAVLHFAASAYVGVSVTDPESYYRNNVAKGLELLSAMVRHNVKNLVFSSTCAVYGEPQKLPLTEDHVKNPVNPYGYTKMVFEQMALDLARAKGLRPVFLRYFNAAGADPEGRLGEDHDPETHLIPLVAQTILGQRENITIFGSDYDTLDGTCVRDYIHILDLAEAHLLALDYLEKGGAPTAFNLGNGSGYSVREVIAMVEKVSGQKAPVVLGNRRAGDPPALVGAAEKARKILGWTQKFGDLDAIVQTAWNWHSKKPFGYRT